MFAARAGLRVIPRSLGRLGATPLRRPDLLLRAPPVPARSFSLFGGGGRTPDAPQPAHPLPPAASTEQIPEETVTTPAVELPSETTEPDIPVDFLDALDASTVPALPLDGELPPWRLGEFHELGIASYFTPPGWLQNALEAFGVATGLPAWALIPTFTLAVRVLTLPLIIRSVSMGAKMQPIHPQMIEIRNSASMTNAAEAQRASLRMRELYASVGYKPLQAAMGPLSQAFFGVFSFFALRGICNLPAEQFKLGGLLWFGDLTVADPLYVLPAVSVAGFLVVNQLSKRDMAPNPDMPHASNGFMVMTCVSFLFLQTLPAALTLGMASNAVLSALQMLLLRVAFIRRLAGLPPRVAFEGAPTMRNTWKALRARFASADADSQRIIPPPSGTPATRPKGSYLPPRARPPQGWQ